MTPLLALEGVGAGYGAGTVLEEVTLALAPGASAIILGRNGVGKTTLLATIMGHTVQHGGRLRFAGRDLARLPPHRRARLGLGYVPQQREIFPSLTVEDNLLVAMRPGGRTTARVFDLFPRLAERRRHGGGQLSGGEQQMLAIGRALMGNPRLLLMDEPLEGLAPIVAANLLAAIARLRCEEAVSILMVEHNARRALAFAERAIILDRGRIVHDGASAELRERPELLAERMGLGAPGARHAARP